MSIFDVILRKRNKKETRMKGELYFEIKKIKLR